MFYPNRLFTEYRSGPVQNTRPKESTKKTKKGLVIEVNENYGRIICARSFKDHGVFVFFTRNTTINGTPMHLGNANLSTAVPIGTEVEFKLTYDFPSTWRNFKTYMGYYCEWLTFDTTKSTAHVFHAELLVKESRNDGLVIASDGAASNVVIHPQIWPSPNTLRKLLVGNELEAKINHRFQMLTQPSRTLLALVRPVPSFLKTKLRRMNFIALSCTPLGTTIVCYAHLVGVGPKELLFDSVGVREDTGDTLPVEIVMDCDLFLSSLGYENISSSKVNLAPTIGRAFQLGCVQNVANQKHPLRAFCAYLCPPGTVPKNPRMPMPRVYSRNVRHTSSQVKAFPPLVVKKLSKLCGSFTRRSFYHKFTVRRSFRANPRKRAFTPCSPYTDLAAKRKNLNETFHDVSISDY